MCENTLIFGSIEATHRIGQLFSRRVLRRPDRGGFQDADTVARFLVDGTMQPTVYLRSAATVAVECPVRCRISRCGGLLRRGGRKRRSPIQ